MKKEKESKLKEISVHMGMFDFEVDVIVGDYSRVVKYIQWKFEDEDFNPEDSDYEPRGLCFFCKGFEPIMWIPKKPKTPREHATLAHECLHVVFHLFEWAKIPVTSDTEEVATHAMAHLITTILDSKQL